MHHEANGCASKRCVRDPYARWLGKENPRGFPPYSDERALNPCRLWMNDATRNSEYEKQQSPHAGTR